MRKANNILVMVLALALCSATIAQADLVSVTSINGGNFIVTSVNGNAVSEDYNENTLIPYPSHDGFAIVNPNFQFFDKTVVLEKNLPAPDEKITTTWHVTNTSNYSWSDYHFVLLGDPIDVALGTPFNSSDFKSETVVSLWEIDFSIGAPGSKLTAPGETNNFTISFDLFGGVQGDQFTFVLRQIATTTPVVPIPGSLLLLGSGILGLMGLRRKL